MPTQLTTETATITTAAIQIRTLTIGKKQVTLAVFRQLREEPLIAEDGTLNGVPWGTVNYHPDKCGDAKEHIHVVWQHGDELRRSHVRAPKHAWHEHPAAGALVHVLVANGLTRADNPPDIKLYGGLPGEGYGAVVQADGVQFHSGVSRDCYNAYSEYGSYGDRPRERLRDQVNQRSRGDALDGLADKFVGQLDVAAGAYKASWVALSELPQLFIAV
jgi:hypothetical protein